jgi:sec-independent protein translocase protein TatA
MGTFSPLHWLIVLLVVVLLFGSKKIPELAKSLGLGIKEFKKATKDGEKETDAPLTLDKNAENKDAKEKPGA